MTVTPVFHLTKAGINVKMNTMKNLFFSSNIDTRMVLLDAQWGLKESCIFDSHSKKDFSVYYYEVLDIHV